MKKCLLLLAAIFCLTTTIKAINIHYLNEAETTDMTKGVTEKTLKGLGILAAFTRGEEINVETILTDPKDGTEKTIRDALGLPSYVKVIYKNKKMKLSK